jgi:hypothetical protein
MNSRPPCDCLKERQSLALFHPNYPLLFPSLIWPKLGARKRSIYFEVIIPRVTGNSKLLLHMPLSNFELPVTMNYPPPYPIFSSKDLFIISTFIRNFFSLPYRTTYSQDLRSVNIPYRRLRRLISNFSRRYVVIHLPNVQRQLSWAFFLAFIRASLAWWKRLILEPKGYLQKMVKKQGIVLLLAAMKAQFALGRPQPAPQAPPPAAGGCSPLELVIGITTTFSEAALPF